MSRRYLFIPLSFFFNRDYREFERGGMAFEEANLKVFVVSVPTCLNRTAFLVGSDPIAGRWLAGSRCSIISCCQRRFIVSLVSGNRSSSLA